MSRHKWASLADLLNAAEIEPEDGTNPPLPTSLYDAAGFWGISYRSNGGNARWFVTGGPNYSEDWDQS